MAGARGCATARARLVERCAGKPGISFCVSRRVRHQNRDGAVRRRGHERVGGETRADGAQSR